MDHRNTDELLGAISAQLGIDLTGCFIIGHEAPTFGLILGDGNRILIGGPNQMLSQSHVRAQLLITGRVTRPQRPNAWARIVESLVRSAERIEHEEYEPSAQLIRLARRYIDVVRSGPPEEAVLSESPVRDGEALYIHAPSLARWISGVRGEVRLTARQLATQLTAAGFVKAFFNATNPKGRQIGRNYWKLP